MTRYASGRRAEWAVRKRLESAGAIVVRSAGSKGPADLVALFDYATFCVQVKRAKPTAAETEAVRAASAKTEARWAMVHYNDGIQDVKVFRKGKPHKLWPPGLVG